MKRYITLIAIACLCHLAALAQTSISKTEGTCGTDTKWTFDGFTLIIKNVNSDNLYVTMDNYGIKNEPAPWVKKKLKVKKVEIEGGIKNIGSCAFANCTDLQEVVFHGTDVGTIGWGAFLNCSRLRNISLPVRLHDIGTVAFANCTSLNSVRIPDRCRVADQAYANCSNLQSVECAPTCDLGHHVFASEVQQGGVTRHSLYNSEIRRLPSYVNERNCHEYGIAAEAVANIKKGPEDEEDYDYATSDVDTIIPTTGYMRVDTYALIIGNQKYRFVSDVPYAIHDARVFYDYCKRTLGIPDQHIHRTENATKQMILEEELEDWVKQIPDRQNKHLIIYYAGHGVPDVKNNNKAYILPTDVRGTNPSRGIALDELYAQLGEMGFNRTSVFLDACFSGVNRQNEGVTEGLRGVEIMAEDATFGDGSVVVFSAAQGNETAQGYPEEGHGLFTYYLLKEIQQTRGDIDYGTLSDNLRSKVSSKALNLKLRKKQTPATNASSGISNEWRYMHF